MNYDLIVLNKYLVELSVPPRIKTLNDRKRVQKAIYLGQAAGADLSYDYNWYVHGPYSPELANDYYELSQAILLDELPTDHETAVPKLKDSYVRVLRSLRPLVEKPADFPLEQEDWLELVSSLHFLQSKERMTLDKAREVIQRKKNHLVEYVDQAQEKLRLLKLLP